MTPALNAALAGLVLAGTLAALAVGEEIPSPQLATVSGPARIIDGDTLDVNGVRVRLWGIDAPEARQTCLDASGRSWACGERATEALRRIVGSETVECRRKDADRYGRMVAICACSVSMTGLSVNVIMVLDGWAVDYARYSRGFYAVDEKAARERRAGIWAGTFDLPEEWRRNHPQR